MAVCWYWLEEKHNMKDCLNDIFNPISYSVGCFCGMEEDIEQEGCLPLLRDAKMSKENKVVFF